MECILAQLLSTYFFDALMALFSIGKSTLSVLFITLPLAALGNSISRLLNFQSKPILPLSIAYGLSLVIFFGYYAHIFHTPLTPVFIILISIGFFLILRAPLYNLYINILKKPQASFLPSICSKNDLLYLTLISAIFFSFNLITLHTITVSPGGGINSDLYYWAANADQYLGKFSFNNLLPHGQEHWTYSIFEDDYAGTYLSIALTSVLINLKSPALVIMPIFAGTIISWIGMTLLELSAYIFSLRKVAAMIVALCVISGSFFHFITYNYFSGQLIATFVFLILLHTALILYKNNEKSPLEIALKLFPLTALLLSVYIRAFFVFISIISIFILTTILFNRLSTISKKIYEVKKFLSSVILSILFSFLSYPIMAKYIYPATVCASQSNLCSATFFANWPLPLLNVFYLFSLPIPFPLSADSPLLSHIYLSLFSIFLGALIMFTLIKKTSFDQKSSKPGTECIYTSGIAFTITLLLYLCAYAIKGNIYQVWKFAAYTILPLSFIPISILLMWLLKILSNTQRLIVAALTIFFLIIATSMSNGRNDFLTLNAFQAIENQLKDTKSIILDLLPRDTMIAMNVYCKGHILIPLSQTYLPPEKLDSINLNSNTKWVTTEYCFNLATNSSREKISATEKNNGPDLSYKIVDNSSLTNFPVVGMFSFEASGKRCLLGNSLNVISGLSGEESFGRWSNAKRVIMQFQVPSILQDRELILKFSINPYLPTNQSNQIVTTYINGKKASEVAFDKPGLLIVKLDKAQTRKQKINLIFKISNPVRPHDLDSNSADTRLIGIAFTNLIIEAH